MGLREGRRIKLRYASFSRLAMVGSAKDEADNVRIANNNVRGTTVLLVVENSETMQDTRYK